ncbi:MAG: GNAT family N-acetyltransferase [Nitrospirae bacterium]|nr:MAG: GNAT family N-acetyltransferase [Nitrospirota bacterium]
MLPSPATIRSYKPDDLAAVIRLLGDLDPWKRLNYKAFLRQRFLFGDYLELFAIAVSVQGRGYGRALLAHLERVVFQRAKNLFVCASDFNHQARRFYERNGYKEIGPILHLLIPGSSEILLRKTTGPAKSV